MKRDFIVKPVRAAAILTTGYVAGTVIDTIDFNQLVAYIGFTIGSLTTAEFKFEFSSDGTTYYQETASSVTAGTDTNTLLIHQIAATGNYRIAIPLKDRYVKISVKGTGTVDTSSMTVNAVLGSV